MENNKKEIKEAIRLLNKNQYIVMKMTNRMIKDMNECAEMDLEGKSKSCIDCSCGCCIAMEM